MSFEMTETWICNSGKSPYSVLCLTLIKVVFEDATTFCSSNNKHVGNQTMKAGKLDY